MAHARHKLALGTIPVDPSLPPSFPPRACTETSAPALQGTVPGGYSPTSLLFSLVAPPKLQAQTRVSADSGCRGPGIQLLLPRECHPPVWPPGIHRAETNPQPRRGPFWATAAPSEPDRAAQGYTYCLWDYLSFRAQRPRPADVGPAEWQEISQGLPPAARSRPIGAARAVREGRAHAHSTSRSSHEQPQPCTCSPAYPALWAARALFLGAFSRLGPGPCLWGPWMVLSEVKVK